MTRLLNTVKLNFRMDRSFLIWIVAGAALGTAIGTVAKFAVITAVLTVFLDVFACGAVFSNEEKSHGERLFGTLPLRRADAVLGRYIFGLGIGVIGTVLAALLVRLVTVITGVGVGQLGPRSTGGLGVNLGGTPALDSLIYWFVISFMFAYFCFSIGIAFPVYYRFGFSRSYFFTMIPLYFVILAVGLFSRFMRPSPLTMSNTITFLTGHVWLLPVAGLVVGLILWFASIQIATRIYANKEI